MMAVTQPTLLIMAGGTGGHVFPALAVALRLRDQGCRVEWLGTEQGIEARVVPQAGIKIHYLQVRGVRGKGLRTKLMAPLAILRALWQARAVIRQVGPVCVLGMGGFASGPGALVARLSGLKVVIHEQNAIAGFTNRILFPFAHRVLSAFPKAFGARQSDKLACVGNPLRQAITDLPPPDERIAARAAPLRLLVLGGSLGAQVLNERVPQALALMKTEQRPEIWHQTGQSAQQQTDQAYKAMGALARVDAFIEQMQEAYAWADFILCRAGALTVSEVASAGLAAIFVPYPYAVDDHQTANARFLAEAGAAVVVPQAELSAERLANLLTQQFSQRDQLLDMAQRAYALGHRDATEQVASCCLELCYG